MKLTDEEIVERIGIADTWLKRFRDADLSASTRYLDFNQALQGTNTEWDELNIRNREAEVPDIYPVGQTNWMAINSEVKIASIAMGAPRVHVKCHEEKLPGASQIVAKAIDQMIANGGWVREFERGLQKYNICGLGVMRYYWHPIWGPTVENVTSNRLLLDPNVVNFRRLEWGGYYVQMSMRHAIERYDPDGRHGFFNIDAVEVEGANLDLEVVKIAVYQEYNGEEVHVHDQDVLWRGKNLYGKVSLSFMEGFADPRDMALPLGENVFASGLAQEVIDMHNIASCTARNGGPINLIDSNQFDEASLTALQEGKPQQFIRVAGQLHPDAPPVHRIPGEELSPAWLPATEQAMNALMAIQGVDVSARGDAMKGVTATQAIMAQSKGGAMPTKVRAKFESWWNEVITEIVKMVQKFGGPQEDEKVTQEENIVWEAFKSVYDVSVIEGSTSFQTPASDQQACMQLYTTTVQSMGLWESLAGRGVVDRIPNMKRLFEDMLQSFARQEIDQYYAKAPQPGPPENSRPPDLVNATKSIYHVSPPDIQRQIEQALGLQPSQMQQQEEGVDGHKVADVMHKFTALDQEAQMSEKKQAHEAAMQENEHVQQMRMIALKTMAEQNKPTTIRKNS
jgi:hypothetical protein